jgi:dihydroorotase
VYFSKNADGTYSIAHYDTHVHWRRLPTKKHLMETTAVRVSGASEEPNTKPHLISYEDVHRSVNESRELHPDRVWYSSFYLTSETKAADVLRAWNAQEITHVKNYPAHGSTHSGESIPHEQLLDKNSPGGKLLCFLEDHGIPYKSHGEVVEWHEKELDPYDREATYFREIQPRLDDLYPRLRQIHAHISTAEAAAYMSTYGDPQRKIAEITGHHAMFDRRITFDGGAYLVDHHCLPPVKRERHKQALQALIRECPSYLVAGSDMAAHTVANKYQCCAFGGYYTYHCSLELYLQVLEELGVLAYAGNFLYGNAKRYFGTLLPTNPHLVRVEKSGWYVTERVTSSDGETFTPFGFHPNPKRRHTFTWQVVT